MLLDAEKGAERPVTAASALQGAHTCYPPNSLTKPLSGALSAP